jgi:hypothetical protein
LQHGRLGALRIARRRGKRYGVTDEHSTAEYVRRDHADGLDVVSSAEIALRNEPKVVIEPGRREGDGRDPGSRNENERNRANEFRRRVAEVLPRK